MKIGLDLDARVELAQITWGSCSSLDKASICPSKIQRKTRIHQEPREGSTGNQGLGHETAQTQKSNPRGQREEGASLPNTNHQLNTQTSAQYVEVWADVVGAEVDGA